LPRWLGSTNHCEEAPSDRFTKANWYCVPYLFVLLRNSACEFIVPWELLDCSILLDAERTCLFRVTEERALLNRAGG